MTTSYRTFVYLNLWSDIDPTEMAGRIRAAMYAYGFAMVEESDKGYNQPAYDTATTQFTVQWTWCWREEVKPLAPGDAGLDDLENDLTNMAAALEFGSGVDRALQAGAKPIEEQMLHNASTDPKIITGALHDFHPYRQGQAPPCRGQGHSPSACIMPRRARTTQIHWNTATAGPAPAPAHPFVRPAFDTRSEDAYDEIRRVLKDELLK